MRPHRIELDVPPVPGEKSEFDFAHFARGRVEGLKPISRMFEEETIEVTCKKCGHEGQESVASLKTDGYTCPKCGASYDSNQLARALKQIEGSFARFSDS